MYLSLRRESVLLCLRAFVFLRLGVCVFVSFGALAWAVVAVLQELFDQVAWPTVGGVVGDCSVPLEKGVSDRARRAPHTLRNYIVSAFNRPFIEQ